MPLSAREKPRSIPPRQRSGRAAGAIVRIATTMAVPTVLRELGVDPVPLLVEFGLRPQFYDDPDNTISFAKSCAILDRAAEATGCAHFGLLVGQRAGLSTLGPLGFLMQSSPSVRSALATAARRFRIHNPAATLDFSEDDSAATFGFRILVPGLPGRDQLTAGAIAIATNGLRSLCGPEWQPYELRFAQAAPADPAPFRRFFRAPLVFDSGESCIVFASRWLDRAPPGADPLLHLLMEKHVTGARSRPTDDLVAQVREILPAMVLAGDATLAGVAARLGLGERTVNRRLAAQATSLRGLLDETRCTLARQLLQDTNLAVYEVGERLGYANPSAFTRAFARWTGRGPAEWRMSQRRPAKRRAR